MEMQENKLKRTTETQCDPAAAVDYLTRLRSSGPWLLWINNAETKEQRSLLFGPDNGPDLRRVLANATAAEFNIYYHVNVTPDDFGKRAREVDIVECPWLHVDIDPRDGERLETERKRILELLRHPPEGVPHPTVIVDSGNGFQALWKLDKPISPDDAKSRNKWLEKQLGGDSCHNADRVLRLPGTVNWPDAKKRKKGRAPANATVVAWDEQRIYQAECFQVAARATDDQLQTSERNAAQGSALRLERKPLPELESIDELALPDDLKQLVLEGDVNCHYPSRSEAVFHAVCSLICCGVPNEVVVAILCDPRFAISERILERGDPLKFAWNEVERISAYAPGVLPERYYAHHHPSNLEHFPIILVHSR